MSDPLTILQGDALSQLRGLESGSVQCCVCSPPYWGLRDYGLEPLVWGNHNGCDHQWGSENVRRIQPQQDSNGGIGRKGSRGEDSWTAGASGEIRRGSFCECGAWRGCLGLEPTPELYVAHLVEIFHELRRVLRANGTLWLNVGDSYSGSWGNYGGQNRGKGKQRTITKGSQAPNPAYNSLESWIPPNSSVVGLKPKDLVGVPWRVAFALQSDGWYLRSDIIWSKPNPMPESVRDRPTRSHEYIFLLSKSERYYYDADVIAERTAYPGDNRALRSDTRKVLDPFCADGGSRARTGMPTGETRNRRTVWTITTQPYSGAHFATFPTEIPRLCILAGSKPGDVVLDPFGGSGTAGKVAIELGRKAILIEPKAEYVEMIKRRCQTNIGLPL